MWSSHATTLFYDLVVVTIGKPIDIKSINFDFMRAESTSIKLDGKVTQPSLVFLNKFPTS